MLHPDQIQEVAEAGTEETREFRIFGPPGTGKTTNLTRQIRRAVDRYGPQSVLVTSFSRAAAAELAGRDLPITRDRVGTLHSHCWHALGGPEVAEANVEEWNRDNPALAITPVKKQGKLDGEETLDEDSETARGGDEELQRLSRYRGLMIPRGSWPKTLLEFEAKWSEYKRENGLLDFTDLIETCLRDVALAPNAPSVIFVDEAQDLNRMQLMLVRKWGERANYFILGGDDDQASLPGSMILTESGVTVPVEALNPDSNRIVSYDLVHSQLAGLRKGHCFSVQPSLYFGQAVRVESGGHATSTTHNHPWLFRWTDASHDKHIVYLMRKGESFRVGWCKLIRAGGSCHLTMRARLEGADAAWILRVCDSRSEASLWESYVAAEYGICTAVWRPIHDQCGGHYTPEVISKLFGMLGDQGHRAARCLRAFGRDLDHPFYKVRNSNRYGAVTNKTAACNLLPTLMAVPVVGSVAQNGVAWQPIERIERFQYDGWVYGLNVPPHHTYVADGIVTHNCIYGFTGAAPDGLLDPDIPANHKIILKQSYRVPRAVHGFAEDLIHRVTRRQEKEYLPRPVDGVVDRFARDGFKSTETAIVPDALRQIEQGKTVMFLASCSYMLRPLIQVLRKHGIPFHNPYRKSNGFWNPLRASRPGSSANRILSLLVSHPDFGEAHRPWTLGDVALWAEWLQAKGILRPGMKSRLKTLDIAQPAAIEQLNELFEPNALEALMGAWDAGSGELLAWWRAHVTADVARRVQFPCEIAARRGPSGLADVPQVVVGTIHAIKGGEADVVYVAPDLSQAGDAQYRRGGAQRDSVIRVFYVAATRAREQLSICQAESSTRIVI